MIEDTFHGESKIKKIGGKLYEDYLAFKKDVFYINVYYFEFFSRLGMADDVSCIIEALQSHKVGNVFMDKTRRDLDVGKIPKEKFLSQCAMEDVARYSSTNPEKARKREENSIRHHLNLEYKNIGEKYLKDNKIYPFDPRHNHKAMDLCGGALYVTPTQLAIDCDKFIEIYGDHLAASESKTGKLHQKAADTINKFFNGVEITQKELERYFTLEDGVIKVNPKSMKRENYFRLGWRSCK